MFMFGLKPLMKWHYGNWHMTNKTAPEYNFEAVDQFDESESDFAEIGVFFHFAVRPMHVLHLLKTSSPGLCDILEHVHDAALKYIQLFGNEPLFVVASIKHKDSKTVPGYRVLLMFESTEDRALWGLMEVSE